MVKFFKYCLFLLFFFLIQESYSQNLLKKYDFEQIQNEIKNTDTSNIRRFNKQTNRFINFFKNRTINDNIPNLQRFFNNYQANKKSHFNDKFQSTNWTELGPKKINSFDPDAGNGRINTIAFNPIKPTEIWVGAASGGLWKSTNNGSNWEVIDMTQFMSIGISDIKFSKKNPNFVYVATGDANGGLFSGTYSIGIIKSTDNGHSWSPTNLISLDEGLLIYELLIHPDNESIVWAATNEGILFTENAGNDWRYLIENNIFTTIKMHPKNPDLLYSATFDWNGRSAVFRSIDAGVNWTEILKFDSINRIKIETDSKNPDNLLLLGSSVEKSDMGVCLKSYNLGENWTDITTAINDAVYGQGFYNLVLFNDPNSDSSFFNGGIYLNYFDSKTKQNFLQNGTHVDFHCVIYNEHDLNYYCGTDGGIYKNRNPKTEKWINLSFGLGITQVYRVTPNPFFNDNIMIGAQDNGVIEFKDSLWYNRLISDGMECVYDNFLPELYYSSTQNAKIYKSNTTNLEKINDINEKMPWTTHYQAHPTKQGQFYFALENLYIYDIYKDTIIKISNFQLKNIVVHFEVYEKNPNYIYLITENELFKTSDAGVNWFKIDCAFQNMTSITIKADNPETIFITNASYFDTLKVMEYQNGKWINHSYRLINLPVNKIIVPKTNPDFLLVATDLGVFAKNIDEYVWYEYGDGLPNVIINDIKINYSTGYLYAGTWGRGVWKAKLWNCENQKIVLNIKDSVTYICPSDSILVKIDNADSDLKYIWSNGFNGTSQFINKPGEYFVAGFDEFGCVSNSKRFQIKHFDTTIKYEFYTNRRFCVGDTIELSVNHTKIFDVKKIFWSTGDTSSKIKVHKSGKYHCYFVMYNNCIVKSTDYEILFNEKPVKPYLTYNKKENDLIVNYDGLSLNSVLWYLDGKRFYTKSIDDLQIKPNYSGIYHVEIYDSNYCKNTSDEIIVVKQKDNQIPIKYHFENGILKMEVLIEKNNNVDIEIYDLEGKFVTKQNNNFNYGYINFDYDLNYFANSVYFAKIIVNKEFIYTLKLQNHQ